MRLFQTNRYLLLAFLVCAISLTVFFYSFHHVLSSYMNAVPIITVLFITLIGLAMAYSVYGQWNDNHRTNYQNLLQMAGKQVFLGVAILLWSVASWIIYLTFMPDAFSTMPLISEGMNTFWLDRMMVFPFIFFWLSAGLLLHRKSGLFSVLLALTAIIFMYIPASRVFHFDNITVHRFVKDQFSSVFSPFPSLQTAVWLVLLIQSIIVLLTLMIVIYQAILAFLDTDKQQNDKRGQQENADKVQPAFSVGKPMNGWGQLGWYLFLGGLTATAVFAYISFATIEPEKSYIFSDSFVLRGAIGFGIFLVLLNMMGLFQIFWKVEAIDLFRINTILISVPLLWCGSTLLYYFLTQQQIFFYSDANFNGERKHVSIAIAVLFGISAGLWSLSIFTKEKISIFILALSSIAMGLFLYGFVIAVIEFYTHASASRDASKNLFPFAPRTIFIAALTASFATLFWSLSVLKNWAIFYAQYHAQSYENSAADQSAHDPLYFTNHLLSKQVTYWILTLLFFPTLFLILMGMSSNYAADSTFAFLFFTSLIISAIILNGLYIASWVFKEQQPPRHTFHIVLINAVLFAVPFFILFIGRLGGVFINLLLVTPSAGELFGFQFTFMLLIFISLLAWSWIIQQLRAVPSHKALLFSIAIAFLFLSLSSYNLKIAAYKWNFTHYWIVYNWFMSLMFLASLATVIWRRDQQKITMLKTQLAT